MSKTDPPLWMLRLLSHCAPVKRLLGRTVGLVSVANTSAPSSTAKR
jgi:hypothetical protein